VRRRREDLGPAPDIARRGGPPSQFSPPTMRRRRHDHRRRAARRGQAHESHARGARRRARPPERGRRGSQGRRAAAHSRAGSPPRRSRATSAPSGKSSTASMARRSRAARPSRRRERCRCNGKNSPVRDRLRPRRQFVRFHARWERHNWTSHAADAFCYLAMIPDGQTDLTEGSNIPGAHLPDGCGKQTGAPLFKSRKLRSPIRRAMSSGRRRPLGITPRHVQL